MNAAFSFKSEESRVSYPDSGPIPGIIPGFGLTLGYAPSLPVEEMPASPSRVEGILLPPGRT